MSGAELRAWRTRLRLTQAGAAHRLGMDQRHYRKLEAGRVAIRRVVALATERIEALDNQTKNGA
jgi:transcriptional regulator with XRE-family HTH domain